jgi:AraC-like DNA-binding protein
MIACGTATFTDPVDFQTRIPRASMRLVLTGRGNFKARLTWVNLRRVSLFRVEESLSRVAFLTLAPGPLFIAFPVRNHLPVLWNGREMGIGAMLLHSNQGDRIYQRSDGPCRWGMISVSPKNLAAYARALAHVDLSPPHTPCLLRPSSTSARNLQRLYAQACRLAETKPDIVAHKEVARALEEDLLYALTHCLIDEGARRDRGPKRHRVLAMARFEDVLSFHCHRPLPLPELCAAIGVAERTLRNCSAQFLRMSPVTYSRLRRLNLVRTALRQADPVSVSVGDVARQHGFSELGRFAVTYRTLFGETPSTTLRGESSI